MFVLLLFLIASLVSSCPGGWVPAGSWVIEAGVFVRNLFLIRVLSFSFLEPFCLGFPCFVFLWRVRFWLRMNAGGVLNTCKSNGILVACYWVRVANG